MNTDFYEDIVSQLSFNSVVSHLQSQIASLNLRNNKQKIFITGNGDSYIAGLVMESLSRAFYGDEVTALTISDSAYVEKFDRNSFLVSISISGRSSALASAMKKNQKSGGKNIAITHNQDSMISELADYVVIIPRISKNRMTPHASDYFCTLLSIGLMLNKITGKLYVDIEEVQSYIQKNLLHIGNIIFQNKEKFVSSSRFIILSSDINYPTALYTELKFWEARGTLAIASNLDEFGHGLHMTVNNSDMVIILPSYTFPSDRLNRIIEGLNKFKINYLHFSDCTENICAENSIAIPAIIASQYPYVHHLLAQWIVYYYAEANMLEVTTGAGRNSTTDFESYNKYLR